MVTNMSGAKLGQHWLNDKRECEKIASVVGLSPDETCIEIGGGKGAISRYLAKSGGRLIVYEIDSHWADHLREHSDQWGGKIEVRQEDALRLAWNRDKLGLMPGETTVVAGNIPYYITSPLFLRLAYSLFDFDRAIFLIQKEVADRICANPGDTEYSRLTVSLGAFLMVEKLHNVPAAAFRPQPKVTSTVIKMTRHPAPLLEPALITDFEHLVKSSFQMRRKTIRNNLLAAYPEFRKEYLDILLSKINIDPGSRPQDIPVAGYIELNRALKK